MQWLVLTAAWVLGGHTATAPLRDVAMAGEAICAVDAGGAVLCTDDRLVPVGAPPARAIAIGSWSWSDLALLDEGGRVHVWRRGEPRVVPLAAPFTAQAIGVHTTVCAFGTAGELACADPGRKAMTVRASVPGVRFTSAKFMPGAIWLRDDAGGLWCEGGSNCARLHHAAQRVPAGTRFDDLAWRRAYPSPTTEMTEVERWRVATDVTRVIVGSDVCVELPGQPLACWNWVSGPLPQPLPAHDELVTVGAAACGRKGDVITCTRLDPRLHELYGESPLNPKREPVTVSFSVPGASRLYAGSTRTLCVEDRSGALWCTEATVKDGLQPPERVRWAQAPSAD